MNNMIRKWPLTSRSSITINRNLKLDIRAESQTRRPRPESSPPWKPQISHLNLDTSHLQMTKLVWQT